MTTDDTTRKLLTAQGTGPANHGGVAASYDSIRSRRKRDVAPHTLSVLELRRTNRRHLTILPPVGATRPATRGDCEDGPRPCPWVSCRYHLYLDVEQGDGLKAKAGSLRLNFPDLEPDEIPATCALDVADGGAAKRGRVAEILNVTRERVRQLEREALQHARRTAGREL